MNLNKTIEQLEQDYWGAPSYSSHLVTTCHRLRQLPLKDFVPEDLRIMIGQSIGLKYLIPLAIEKLQENILADGDCYDGDLLFAVLNSDSAYWQKNRAQWRTICALFEKNAKMLAEYPCTKSIKKGWQDSYEQFRKIE